MSVSKHLLQHSLLAAALGGMGTTLACAQTTRKATVYGSFDQYLSHMRSSSGQTGTKMEGGATNRRSRLGFRGQEDLGKGLSAKFQLELGLNAEAGNKADANRLFDRQAWVGLVGAWGEFRIGRQNTAIFIVGDYTDSSYRTLGSVVNSYGVPSRFDNDLSYRSLRIAGLRFEAHYAMTPLNMSSRQAVYQAALDYENGPFRIGYAGLLASPPGDAVYKKDVRYDTLYVNYDYGRGKVYLNYVRSNNSSSVATGGVTTNNTGSVLSNVGGNPAVSGSGVVAGSNANVNSYHRIWQISADYRVQDKLRIGATLGQIREYASRGGDAVGGSIALTMMYPGARSCLPVLRA